MDNVFYLSAATAEGLIDELELTPDQVAERACLRFIFNSETQNLPKSAAVARYKIAQDIKDRLAPRLEFLSAYQDDFFEDPYFRHQDDVTIAVLCGPLAKEAFNSIGKKEGNIFPLSNISAFALKESCEIYKDAQQFLDPNDSFESKRDEIVYVGHTISFENIAALRMSIRQGFKDVTEIDLNIWQIERFIRRDCKIGEVIQYGLEMLKLERDAFFPQIVSLQAYTLKRDIS